MSIRYLVSLIFGGLLLPVAVDASEQPDITGLNAIDSTISQASRAVRAMTVRPGSQFAVAQGLLSDITYRTANLIGHAAPELRITGAGATVTDSGKGFALGWYVRTEQAIDQSQAEALCEGLLDGIREGLGYAADGTANGQVVGDDGIPHGLVLAAVFGALNQSVGANRRAIALAQALAIEAHSGLWAAVGYGDDPENNAVCIEALRLSD
ncbi:MAG: hypothetical protein DHS20C11_01280 [Lysobacteraceae bacterium]|nr:MAG: hypothetical protein DHS20C11_01280 [Xanthomonadaceae bacterium]